jgi:hypothetical protein
MKLGKFSCDSLISSTSHLAISPNFIATQILEVLSNVLLSCNYCTYIGS